MVAKETTCTHCGEVFESKGKYQTHYRNNHRDRVRKRENTNCIIVEDKNSGQGKG